MYWNSGPSHTAGQPTLTTVWASASSAMPANAPAAAAGMPWLGATGGLSAGAVRSRPFAPAGKPPVALGSGAGAGRCSSGLIAIRQLREPWRARLSAARVGGNPRRGPPRRRSAYNPPAQRGVRMHPIVISAPFGNYLNVEGVTSTVGTYTVRNRAGFLRWRLFWRMLYTLRPMFRVKGWVNRLGLPNPGLEFLRSKGPAFLEGKLLSVHGFDEAEWDTLLEFVRTGCPPTMAGVELNVSCPNVGHLSVPATLFDKAMATGARVVVKLPPVNWWPTFQAAYAAGVRTFHCCNTLPSPAGGISGKPLKPVALDVIQRIRDSGLAGIVIIGGGGITTEADIADYRRAGADHFGVGTVLFKPRYWPGFLRRRLLHRLDAAARCAENLASGGRQPPVCAGLPVSPEIGGLRPPLAETHQPVGSSIQSR